MKAFIAPLIALFVVAFGASWLVSEASGPAVEGAWLTAAAFTALVLFMFACARTGDHLLLALISLVTALFLTYGGEPAAVAVLATVAAISAHRLTVRIRTSRWRKAFDPKVIPTSWLRTALNAAETSSRSETLTGTTFEARSTLLSLFMHGTAAAEVAASGSPSEAWAAVREQERAVTIARHEAVAARQCSERAELESRVALYLPGYRLESGPDGYRLAPVARRAARAGGSAS